MARDCECPKCKEDTSDSFQDYDPDVGIMSAGWYCEKCETLVIQDDEVDYER